MNSTAPAQPWTAEQRKLLCTVLRQRGLWEDRHAVCGVRSLSELTRDQAARIIDRLVSDRPTGRARNRPTAGMTKHQRSLLYCIWRDTGYAAGGLPTWLRQQGFDWSLADDYIDPTEGRDAIDRALNLLEERSAHHGWTFQRTRDGYELTKGGVGVSPANQEPIPF